MDATSSRAQRPAHSWQVILRGQKVILEKLLMEKGKPVRNAGILWAGEKV